MKLRACYDASHVITLLSYGAFQKESCWKTSTMSFRHCKNYRHAKHVRVIFSTERVEVGHCVNDFFICVKH